MIRVTRYEAAAFGGPLEAVQRDLPGPTGSQVVVEVSHCGVCHSDLHVHHGAYEIGEGKELRFEDRGVRPPLVLGHEIVGRVVAAGPDAAVLHGSTPVAVYPWVGCGACFRCAAGEDHLCDDAKFLGIFQPGGYSSHVVVPHPRYLFDIGGIAPESAALLGCSGLTSFGALKKIATYPKDAAVLVIGAGGLGQTAIALARQLGWSRLIALDPSPEKRALATGAGAADAADPATTDGRALKALARAPILAVLDFVAAETTAGFATDVLEKGGTLVLVGLFGGEFRYPLPLFPVRSLTVMGSYVGSLQEMAEYVAHVRIHGAPKVPITTRPMEMADAALRDLSGGKVAGRTVLVNGLARQGA